MKEPDVPLAAGPGRLAADDGPLRVCLFGAGAIAETHAEVLSRLPGVRLAAVVDPSLPRAQSLARRWGAKQVFADPAEALAAGDFQVAHVLAPPDEHFALAEACLRSGRHVLVEKPLAANLDDARELAWLAQNSGLVAGVNQNFVLHPAFARLKRIIERGEAGPLRSVHVAYNAPLRQLAARQFGAWMFRRPKNILLEQAVHPLSQIISLIGPIQALKATAAPGEMIAKDLVFHASCDALLQSATQTAHLQFAVGRSFPCWRLTAICDDGVLVADMFNNRLVQHRRGPYSEPLDALVQSLRTGGEVISAGLANARAYALSLMRLRPRSDPFFLSMRASIGGFYEAVRGGGTPPVSFGFGAELIEVCERIADQSFASGPAVSPAPAQKTRSADVAVLGGTGLIGRAVVARLRAEGKRVRVLARGAALDEVFADCGVCVLRGDIRDRASVEAAIDGAPVVVNLAHGGGGDSWEAIRDSMVGGARIVAEACLAAGAARLIHVGSIAGLYAGDPRAVITGDTPPDAGRLRRADYARAKAEADDMLLRMHREAGLPVCILRPGIVVGGAGSPFHSGLGVFNNDQHCIGWNRGDNPLPLVLVDDVAAAIANAAGRKDVIGRCYNLVGDVRLSASDYMEALSAHLQRPLRYHPSSVGWLYLQELGKWVIKRAAGRRAPLPQLYDLRSRGLVARFVCSDAKRDLAWRPESDRTAFLRRAFASLS